jgi:hypothetical protein
LKGDGFKISVQQQDIGGGGEKKVQCVAWFYAKLCMVKKNEFENVFKRAHWGYLKKTLNTPHELYSTHLVVNKVQPCAKPHGFVTWFDFSFSLYIYIKNYVDD